LDGAGQVGLVQGQGAALRLRLSAFSELLIEMLEDIPGETSKMLQAQIASVFYTGPEGSDEWEEALFRFMPVAAAITVLTKVQNDVRNAEAEVVQFFRAQTDAGDFRVNRIDAMVIPNSRFVIRGGTYTSQIVLAAVDTTAVPVVTIGGRVIEDGLFRVPATTVGTFTYSGYIELPVAEGEDPIRRHFTSTYTVGEPVAIISADMMNVVYGAIDNPISVSVPGVPSAQVQATMDGGTLTRTATGWVARPSADRIGREVTISVSATLDGRTQPIGSRTFRVRALPSPTAFIEFRDRAGTRQKHREGRLDKAALLESPGVRAELLDSDLNIQYTVLGFQMSYTDAMGNTIIEVSDGNRFSARQLSQIRGFNRGRMFMISRIRATGPDGQERALSPIEVVVH